MRRSVVHVYQMEGLGAVVGHGSIAGNYICRLETVFCVSADLGFMILSVTNGNQSCILRSSDHAWNIIAIWLRPGSECHPMLRSDVSEPKRYGVAG